MRQARLRFVLISDRDTHHASVHAFGWTFIGFCALSEIFSGFVVVVVAAVRDLRPICARFRSYISSAPQPRDGEVQSKDRIFFLRCSFSTDDNDDDTTTTTRRRSSSRRARRFSPAAHKLHVHIRKVHHRYNVISRPRNTVSAHRLIPYLGAKSAFDEVTLVT